MLSTPPHTKYKIQPLDRTFMKPFKAAYNDAISLWMRAHPGSRIGQYDIAALVAQDFSRAARLDIAQNGFKCAGIYPLNRNIFTDLDFLPSMITDIPESAIDNLAEGLLQNTVSNYAIIENETIRAGRSSEKALTPNELTEAMICPGENEITVVAQVHTSSKKKIIN